MHAWAGRISGGHIAGTGGPTGGRTTELTFKPLSPVPLLPFPQMASRPVVNFFSESGEASGSLPLPAVLTAPIRLDVVAQVHSQYRDSPWVWYQ